MKVCRKSYIPNQKQSFEIFMISYSNESEIEQTKVKILIEPLVYKTDCKCFVIWICLTYQIFKLCSLGMVSIHHVLIIDLHLQARSRLSKIIPLWTPLITYLDSIISFLSDMMLRESSVASYKKETTIPQMMHMLMHGLH